MEWCSDYNTIRLKSTDPRKDILHYSNTRDQRDKQEQDTDK